MRLHCKKYNEAFPDHSNHLHPQGMKIVAAGTNPVQLTRGMEKTVAALVKELKTLSTEVKSDKDLANVASVSAGEGMDCLESRCHIH